MPAPVRAPTSPPVAAPAPAPTRVDASQPAATTGPNPGIASMPRPASKPAPPPSIAPSEESGADHQVGRRRVWVHAELGSPRTLDCAADRSDAADQPPAHATARRRARGRGARGVHRQSEAQAVEAGAAHAQRLLPLQRIERRAPEYRIDLGGWHERKRHPQSQPERAALKQ